SRHLRQGDGPVVRGGGLTMAGLYTSLSRAKAEINNGELPPMEPLGDKERRLINPKFLINGGKGGIVKHPTKGLRCPVRGCGRWYHHRGRHGGKSHPEIGGADGL